MRKRAPPRPPVQSRTKAPKRPKPKFRRPSVCLTQAELDRLLAACGDHDSGVRDRALFALMAATGMRVGEALAVRIQDIDRDKKRVSVVMGKGGESRTVGIWPWCFGAIDAWIEIRNGPPPDGYAFTSGPLCCNLKGRRMSTDYIRRIIKDHADAAGIERRAHPHGLRHFVAVAMLERGASVMAICRQLGHSNVARTHNYLSTIGADRLLADFDALG